MIALVAVLSAALPLASYANGVHKPAAKPTAKPTAKPASPPVGAGPSAAAPAVATPTAINQRGHVNNMAEAQQMMMLLVQQKGGMSTFGDYMVAYVVESPKGWYEPSNGSLTWRPPAPTETQHIEAVIMDSLTGQMLPMTGVTLDVLDASGNVVQSQPLAFYWHPMADHYGANYSIPTAGSYTLRVKAPAPDIRRHSIKLGNRFADPLDASFANVQLTPLTPDPTELAAPGAEAPAGSEPAVMPSTPSETITPSTPSTEDRMEDITAPTPSQ
jgi:hypothetical protein